MSCSICAEWPFIHFFNSYVKAVCKLKPYFCNATLYGLLLPSIVISLLLQLLKVFISTSYCELLVFDVAAEDAAIEDNVAMDSVADNIVCEMLLKVLLLNLAKFQE